MTEPTEEYKGYKIVIEPDEVDESPRDWNNLGIMLCSHRRYTLGDEELNPRNFDSLEEVEEWIEDNYHPVIQLPLYLYDHSGLSMRTYPHGYHSAWDCGMVGWIVATADDIRKWYGVKRITKTILERATKELVGEVKTYSQYLEGDVWCWQVFAPADEDCNDPLESCGGCYGCNFALQDAKDMIDYLIGQDEAKQWQGEDYHTGKEG